MIKIKNEIISEDLAYNPMSIQIKLFDTNINLEKLIECISYKYKYTTDDKPCMKKTKKFIINSCFNYFGINISLKQINRLLYPGRGWFPCKACIILMTIYNLLKENCEDQENLAHIYDLIAHINLYDTKNDTYIEFSFGELVNIILDNKEVFMTNENQRSLEYLICSKNKLEYKLGGDKWVDICIKHFIKNSFIKDDVPNIDLCNLQYVVKKKNYIFKRGASYGTLIKKYAK